MKALLIAIPAIMLAGQAMAETYSTRDQYDKVRNHATHEAAEAIILSGQIISSTVERGTHIFAVISDDHLFNCVMPWDSHVHCRSETSEPLYTIRK